jgi:hypothetical protein
MTPVEICNLALLRINQPLIASLDDAAPQAKACKLLYKYCADLLLSKYNWSFFSEIKKPTKNFGQQEEYANILKEYDARIKAKTDDNKPDTAARIEENKGEFINFWADNCSPYNYFYTTISDAARIISVSYEGITLTGNMNAQPYKISSATKVKVVPNDGDDDDDTDTFELDAGVYLLSDYYPLDVYYVHKYVGDGEWDEDLFTPNFIECLSLAIAIRLTKQFNDNIMFLQGLTAMFEDALAKAKIDDCQQQIIQSPF